MVNNSISPNKQNSGLQLPDMQTKKERFKSNIVLSAEVYTYSEAFSYHFLMNIYTDREEKTKLCKM